MIKKIRLRLVIATVILFSLNNITSADCPQSSLVNGLDIQIGCLSYNNQYFQTQLKNLNGDLVWYWEGQMEPITCQDTSNYCASVDASLGLNFSSMNISGQIFNADLKYAPEQGGYHWIYANHSPVSSDTGTNIANSNSGTSNTHFDENDASMITQFLTDAVSNKSIPGAVLAITSADKVLYTRPFGYSNVTSQTDMTTENLLHIGSTNKMLTSFMIATLVDDGIISWETKAQDIYPQFTIKNSKNDAAAITMRQLLDMSAGLPKDVETTISQARELLDGSLDITLLTTPGESYEYSNVSTSIAAYLAVLAKAKHDNGNISDSDLNNLHSGYVQLLTDKVLKPIGMTNSYLYVNDARKTGNMANSHEKINGQFVVSESIDQNIDFIAPAGGLKSTITDMIKYIQTELNQGLAPNDSQILSSNVIAQRYELINLVEQKNEYGLCLEVKEVGGQLKFIGHNGSFDNFNSLMGYFPDKQIGFVLLINGESPEALSLTGEEFNQVLATLLSN